MHDFIYINREALDNGNLSSFFVLHLLTCLALKSSNVNNKRIVTTNYNELSNITKLSNSRLRTYIKELNEKGLICRNWIGNRLIIEVYESEIIKFRRDEDD